MDNKILHISSSFIKSVPLPTADGKIDSIYIEGYANTTAVDRSGDVIPKVAWEKGLENYLKNPIILAYHDHDEPIGRMEEHDINDKGLWIKARISAAAEDVFNLIKDGVLTAFSVGFIIKDATYDAATDLFIIKELELLEVSVVAVPCNQDSTFSISKAFDSAEDFISFKKQFATEQEAKGPQSSEVKSVQSKKEFNMDPKELEALLAKTAAEAAATVIASQEKAAAEKAAKEAEEKALSDRVDAIVAEKVKGIELGQSGAEKLLADVEKRLEEEASARKSVLEGLESSIKEKAAELEAIQKSKMQFASGAPEDVAYADREKAFLLAKVKGCAIDATKFGRSVVEKAGAHVASATWELEVSRNMEDEIRRQLVVAPLVKNIQMQTNVMTIPVNPEAGDATWITNAQFGTTASPGAAQTHQLKEITLNAYKVATMEYLAYEEEEDSLLALLPVIRDAMVRRVSRAVDKAYLLGAGSGADPVKGFATYDATSAVVPTNTGVATIANLRSLRKDLGVYGLNPADIFFIVSTDIYYDLLDDTSFQTVNNVGPQAATFLTGQVGVLAGTPVLVSSQFPTKAGGAATAATNIGAIAVAPANFIGGSQRGLRFDTQDLVETQRKVMVNSLRLGMTQLSTVNGMGVSTLRWS